MEDKATTEDNLREVWRVVDEICRQTNGRLATDRQTDRHMHTDADRNTSHHNRK